jgi:hypothetical protein
MGAKKRATARSPILQQKQRIKNPPHGKLPEAFEKPIGTNAKQHLV